jgi:hypothetical protein
MAEKLMATIGTVRKEVSTIVSPDLSEIKTELKVLNTRTGEMDRRLTSSIDSLRNELRAEIKAVDTKVGEIDKKLDIDRRMLIMESKMKELEKRS